MRVGINAQSNRAGDNPCRFRCAGAEVDVLDGVTLAPELRLDAFAEFVGVWTGHEADAQHVSRVTGSVNRRRLKHKQRDSGKQHLDN